MIDRRRGTHLRRVVMGPPLVGLSLWSSHRRKFWLIRCHKFQLIALLTLFAWNRFIRVPCKTILLRQLRDRYNKIC